MFCKVESRYVSKLIIFVLLDNLLPWQLAWNWGLIFIVSHNKSCYRVAQFSGLTCFVNSLIVLTVIHREVEVVVHCSSAYVYSSTQSKAR